MRVSLYAEFVALPGKEARVSQLIAQFARDVRAEKGNVAFEPFHIAESRGAFFVAETYIDDLAFERHIASEHGRQFNLSIGPLIVGGRTSLTMLHAIEVPA